MEACISNHQESRGYDVMGRDYHPESHMLLPGISVVVVGTRRLHGKWTLITVSPLSVLRCTVRHSNTSILENVGCNRDLFHHLDRFRSPPTPRRNDSLLARVLKIRTRAFLTHVKPSLLRKFVGSSYNSVDL